eukprot:4655367-Pleurochrysis_carterae.AAC.1
MRAHVLGLAAFGAPTMAALVDQLLIRRHPGHRDISRSGRVSSHTAFRSQERPLRMASVHPSTLYPYRELNWPVPGDPRFEIVTPH